MTRSAMYSVVVGVLGVALACTGVVAAGAAVEIDSRLPSYERVEGVSGTIKSMGSDTKLNVMTHWAEGYRRHYPSVTIEIEGKGSSQFLWHEKEIVPFLKVDKGLADEQNGVQVMKPIPGLGALLERARSNDVFGTKMRSVINAANPVGIAANAAQQFEIGHQILGHGLMPILEPEININISDKDEAEGMLLAELTKGLDTLAGDQQVMLKLSIPTTVNRYKSLIDDPRVMRVVALSGGYNRDDANALLAKNDGMIASFSRALAEGLSDGLSDDQFNATLAGSIDSSYAASASK